MPSRPPRSSRPCSTSAHASASANARWFGVTRVRKYRASVCSRTLGTSGQTTPPGQPRRADRGAGQRVVVEPDEVHVQEREVEPGVVRDEDRAATELQERRQDLLDRRLGGDRSVVDAGQVRDERRDRDLGVDQRLERSDALAAEVLDRPDLGDPAVGGGAARGLEVHHAERDLVERDAQVERGLDGRGEHDFLRPVGPCGDATISNRCSSVKHPPPSWGEATTRRVQRWTRARLAWGRGRRAAGSISCRTNPSSSSPRASP